VAVVDGKDRRAGRVPWSGFGVTDFASAINEMAKFGTTTLDAAMAFDRAAGEIGRITRLAQELEAHPNQMLDHEQLRRTREALAELPEESE
jgi:hypothetical protein